MEDHSSEPVYMRGDWLSLRWSAWMPLMAAHPLALAQLPSEPGLYRVRRSRWWHELEWIGWADGSVREVVERLSRQVHLPVEPFDDARSAAGALWSLRRTQDASFEVSGAAVSAAEGDGWEREQLARHAYSADRASEERSTR